MKKNQVHNTDITYTTCVSWEMFLCMCVCVFLLPGDNNSSGKRADEIQLKNPVKGTQVKYVERAKVRNEKS